MKGYLRIEKDPDLGKYAAAWYYDDEDPDETTIVLDIQKVYVVTDADGNVIPNAVTKEPEISTAYQDIGIESGRRFARGCSRWSGEKQDQATSGASARIPRPSGS